MSKNINVSKQCNIVCTLQKVLMFCYRGKDRTWYVVQGSLAPRPLLVLLRRYHQLSGGSEKLQVGALLGAFQVVRELLASQAS